MGSTLVFLFIIFATILFIIVSNCENKKKIEGSHSATNTINKKPGWKSWIWPVIIAILFSFWSVIFGLFLLANVWVMKLDPTTDSKKIPFPSDKDRKRAKGTYTWLLISAVPNILIFAIAVINLSSRSSANERVLAALTPLIIHLPVLIRLDFKSPFVFRHTQQAVLLLALRASTAALALNVSRYPEDGIGLFLLANGFLWLFGSLWGRAQVNKGKGWWIEMRGETVLNQDSQNMSSDDVKDSQHSPEKSIEFSRWYLKNNNKEAAIHHALVSFRNGKKDIRGQAVQLLNELGEVENF